MGVLEGLKPERVFYYFEEICKIPHGSYNVAAISDYCVSVAQSLNLEVRQDGILFARTQEAVRLRPFRVVRAVRQKLAFQRQPLPVGVRFGSPRRCAAEEVAGVELQSRSGGVDLQLQFFIC